MAPDTSPDQHAESVRPDWGTILILAAMILVTAVALSVVIRWLS